MTAPSLLVLEDGTAFRGEALRRRRDRVRRGGVQHRADRLPGGPDRPRLPPADRDDDVPAPGQLRRQRAPTPSPRACRSPASSCREASRRRSNHRADGSLQDDLLDAGVVGISEVDTRRLTRHMRSAGAMRAGISTEVLDADALLEQVRRRRRWRARTWPREVSTPHGVRRSRRRRGAVPGRGLRLRDQAHILALLTGAGCDVRVVPATTPPTRSSRTSPTACSSPTARATPRR